MFELSEPWKHLFSLSLKAFKSRAFFLVVDVVSRSDNSEPQRPVLVVGVGASAGGLEAFNQLLSALPTDTGLAFVLIQHLDPTHKSLLSEILALRTAMPVRDAEQNERVRANCIYVIRPDCSLAVRGGRIELTEPTLHRGVRLTVDHLFHSLAREYRSRSVGIVLSGAGSDGSAGLRDIKSAGGLAIVQDPATCGQTGMPQSAIDTGLVDLVLAIDEMPAALSRFASLPPTASLDPYDDAVDGGTGDTEDDESASHGAVLDNGTLARLTAMLEAQLGFDLSVYKRGTVDRRVLRRMALSGFEDVDPWLDHVREHADEQRMLVRDMMISVTGFFRDGAAFNTLRELVIEPLLAAASQGAAIRAWVAGCATGEEAYSIGMELLEAADARSLRIEPQIFATDVDLDALAVARAAIYPVSITEQVSTRRLTRYFEPIDGRGYRVRSRLRDVVSFANHDLTKDPPFSRMDLVSCRNVLIYLTPEAQANVLSSLHFALRPQGHLFLGTSESVGPRREMYAIVSKAAHLYSKVGASAIPSGVRSRKTVAHLQPAADHAATARTGETVRSEPRRRHLGDPLRSAVLEACVPPTVVVEADGTVVFVHGELGAYLRFPQGDEPRLEIGECLRPEIATRVRSALFRCRREGRRTVALATLEGGAERVRIVARPAPRLGDATVVLSFEAEHGQGEPNGVTVSASSTLQPTIGAGDDGPRQGASEGVAFVQGLEYELQATREDLKNTVEELETSNEELRSSNEDSISMNEELQSGNEELEATTEELRSLNEELTTVNAQLREKLDQLEQANDDLGNFFASARVAIIFLDERLRIKRFTPAAAMLLHIDHVDIGRFTGDIARELLQDDLEHEAREVLDQLVTRSRELRTRDGRWFARSILPYRTESRRIEGVVVTLVDISELKIGAERLATRERQQAVIARLGLAALREPDLESFMENVVREVSATLELDFCTISELQPGKRRLLLRIGTGWREGIADAAWESASEGGQAEFTLSARAPVLIEDLATESRFTVSRLLVEHEVKSGLACAILDGGERYGILGGYTRRTRSFAQEDASFIQAVGNIVGSAVGGHQNRRRMAIEHDVSRTLVVAEQLDEVLESLRRCVADTLEVEVVDVSGTNAGDSVGGELPEELLHVATQERHAAVHRAQAERREVVDEVLRCDRAVWLTDVGVPPLLEKDGQASQLGLRTALGFPVRSRDRTLGVVVLYSRERLIGSTSFLRGLESVGAAIGEFVVRIDLERRNARMAAITRFSHDAIFSYDHDGLITEWLPGAEQLYGFSIEEMIGQPSDRLMSPERHEAAALAMAQAIEGEFVEPFETIRTARDGREVEVSVTLSPIRDREGRITGISSIERDIGRLKRTERRLLAADHQKDEFLAMLGHELRNPLASIRSAAQLLGLEDDLGPDILRTRDILRRQSAHMSRLLDGLLDVSRIVQNKIELAIDDVDLVEICREVLDDASERLEEHGLTLHTRLSDAPVPLRADRVRLVQVVDNLLSNAIKYTPRDGRIEVGVERERNLATLRVSDTGIGIDEALLPHVFDVFRQSAQNLDRAGGGLGLGLALVRAVVDLHGGTVEAHSLGEGQGADLVVRLPISNLPTGRVADGGDTPGSDLDILLVEDNADSADILARVLERLGHRVRVASDGRTAVQLAVDVPPDLMVCDLGLPDGFSGYDVAAALRKDPATQGIRLVALTGYGRPEDKSRSAQAGFDAHLTKPVGVAELRDMLDQHRKRVMRSPSG